MKYTHIAVKFILVFLVFNVSAQGNYFGYNNKKTNYIFEDFENKNLNWATGTANNSNGYVAEGHYFWSSLNEKSQYSTKSFYLFDDTKDYEIEARLRRWTGSSDGQLLQLIFGASGHREFLFGYTPNGYFRIDEYKDNQYKVIKDYTKSAAIIKGSFNKLTVRKVGGTFEFYINSELVHSTYSRPLPGKRFGFQAPKFTKLKIDYLRISYLKKNFSIYNAVGGKSKYPFFEENFLNNKNEWSKGNGKTSKGILGSRTYTWKSLSNNTVLSSKFISIDTSKDFELQTQIKCYVAGKNNSLQSFYFGGTGGKRYYFGFNKNGYFLISKYDGSRYTPIKDWTKSSTIKPNDFNDLTIRKIDKNMYFFINERLVHSCESLPFYGNEFGFGAASNSELEIDGLTLYYIKGI